MGSEQPRVCGTLEFARAGKKKGFKTSMKRLRQCVRAVKLKRRKKSEGDDQEMGSEKRKGTGSVGEYRKVDMQVGRTAAHSPATTSCFYSLCDK